MKLQCQLIVKHRTYVLVVLVNESEIGKGQGRAVSTMVTVTAVTGRKPGKMFFQLLFSFKDEFYYNEVKVTEEPKI